MTSDKSTFLGNITKKPKLVFFIDAFGAGISLAILFLVGVKFQPQFGMPKSSLLLLALIALAFFMYSSRCYSLVKTNWKPFLRLIMLLNCSYAILSIGLIIYHFDVISTLGLVYFSAEILVLCAIIYIEWKTLTFPRG